MKTKELIDKLQKEDPSGELEVCVGNLPIYFLEKLPAYYDGPLEMLIQDRSKDPYYNIVGYKITTKGDKLNVVVYDLDSWLTDDPDGSVDTSEVTTSMRLQIENRILQIRAQAKENQ